MADSYDCEPAFGACNAEDTETGESKIPLIHHCRMGQIIKHTVHVCTCGFEWEVVKR